MSFFFFFLNIKLQNWQHGIQSLVLKIGAASSPVPQIPWASGLHIRSGASIPLYNYICAGPNGVGAGPHTLRGSLSTLPVSVLLSEPEVWGRLAESLTHHSSLEASPATHPPSFSEASTKPERWWWSTLPSQFLFFLLIYAIQWSRPVVLNCLRPALSYPCHKPSSIL